MKLRVVFAAAIVLGSAPPAFTHHVRYTANLTGAAESPSNGSPGIGHAVVTIDFDLVSLRVDTSFSALQGTITAAHIHAPTASPGSGTADVATQVPSFSGFPTGVTSGSYDHEFDLAEASTYNPAFITASGGTVSDALNALVAALDEGKAYLNIHTTAYPGGEIRGFLIHVPGDYNDNGVVDGADYVLWRHTQGETGEGLAADSNNDNVIDEDDYLGWRENFGHAGLSSGSASGTVNPASVPEPAPVVLLIAAFVALLWVRAH